MNVFPNVICPRCYHTANWFSHIDPVNMSVKFKIGCDTCKICTEEHSLSAEDMCDPFSFLVQEKIARVVKNFEEMKLPDD